MGDQPLWEQIGRDFVQHYYCTFDRNRCELASLYIEASCLSWEGQQFQGKSAIVEKINGLPFGKIQHIISTQDHQPTPDCSILSMVVGQLQNIFGKDNGDVVNWKIANTMGLVIFADDDPVMGFHQIFLLKRINDAWVCTNDVFRLGLHNFC